MKAEREDSIICPSKLLSACSSGDLKVIHRSKHRITRFTYWISKNYKQLSNKLNLLLLLLDRRVERRGRKDCTRNHKGEPGTEAWSWWPIDRSSHEAATFCRETAATHSGSGIRMDDSRRYYGLVWGCGRLFLPVICRSWSRNSLQLRNKCSSCRWSTWRSLAT